MKNWASIANVQPRQFTCGFCGFSVSSEKGWYTNNHPQAWIYSCPNCGAPSYFDGPAQVPGVAPGNEVGHLPASIDALYRESRRCIAVGSATASVLASRKLLMHIAVEQGAKPGDTFISYVEYLAKNGYVPPNGKGWVDHIRKKGNEANHEIVLMSADDAGELIAFSEMLLKFIYEFPNRVPKDKP